MQQNSILEKFQEKFNKNPKFYLILASVIFIIGVSVIIFFAIYNTTHDEKITITNIDDYVGTMPNDKKQDIFSTLYRAAEINSDKDVATLSTATATIREKTFSETYDSYTLTYSGEFVVDIESIKQTYHIYYDWSKDRDTDKLLSSSYSASANCPNKSEMIYDFFLCKNPYSDPNTAKYDTLSEILPYSTETKNGTSVSVSTVDYYYGSEEPFIRVSVDACGEDKLVEEGKQLFKSYLLTYNLNIDDYNVLTQNLCDGGDL